MPRVCHDDAHLNPEIEDASVVAKLTINRQGVSYTHHVCADCLYESYIDMYHPGSTYLGVGDSFTVEFVDRE